MQPKPKGAGDRNTNVDQSAGWRLIRTSRLARAAVAVLAVGALAVIATVSYTIGDGGDPPPWSCHMPDLAPGPARPWEGDMPISAYAALNTNTGNVFTAIPIVGWTGLGPPLQFNLYHNAASVDSPFDRTAGTGFDLGGGWSCSYSSHLISVNPTTIIVVRDDGTQDEYNRQGNQWIPPAGVNDTLAPCQSGTVCYEAFECTDQTEQQWWLKDKDQSYRWYCMDSSDIGRLGKVDDGLGNGVDVVWQNDRIEKIIDAAGRELWLSFDGSGRLETIEDPCEAGETGWICYQDRTWSLCYDGSDRIQAVIDPPPFEYELLLGYDIDGRISSISDDKEANPGWGDGCEVTCQGTEDCFVAHPSTTGCDIPACCGTVCDSDPFCCLQAWDQGCADAALNLCDDCVTGGAPCPGYTYTYYTEGLIAGRFAQVTDPLSQTQGFTMSCPEELVWRGVYTDERGSEWKYRHDFNGNLTAIVDPLNHSQAFAFDTDRNLVQYLDALLNERTFSYDSRGNLLSRTADPGGLNITETWQYDDCGGECNNLRFYTDGEDNTIEFRYEESGYATLLTKIIEPPAAVGGDSSVIVFSYENPWSGQVSKIVRGEGLDEQAPTEMGFDAWGQLNRFTEGMSIRQRICLFNRDSGGRDTGWGCSPSGDPNSSGGSSSPDSHGRSGSVACIPVRTQSGSPPVDHPTLPPNRPWLPGVSAAWVVLPNGYSPRDELLDHQALISDGRVPEAHIRSFSNDYDELGRLLATTTTSSETGSGISRGFTHEYDWILGEYTRTDLENVETSVVYDVANRVTSMRRDDLAGTVLQASYTYLDNDRVDTVSFGNGTSTSYEYDAAQRVTAITHLSGATQLLRLQYTYDDRNLVEYIEEYEDEVQVAYVDFTYDDRSRLTHEVRHHNLDPSRSYDLEYQYDDAGNRTKKIDQISLMNTLETTYHYDYEDAGWESDYNQLMWSTTCARSGGMFGPMGPGGGGGGLCLPVSERYYYYNDDGNVTNVVTKKLSPGPSEKQFSATWVRYAVNNRTVTFAVGDEWDVDENGDPIPASYNILWGREYRYDKARARYLYSVLDPVKLESGDVDGTDTWSQYDGDEIYADYTISGQDVTVTTWYEPGIGKVEDVDETPVVKYYHDNLIGTTRFMTDASGEKIKEAVYTAFGELVSGDARRFGYAGAYGYQTDQPGEMPFLHIGHRYYDPAIGRFLQRDPMGARGGLNVYNYVGAGPTTVVDPEGLGPLGGVKSLGEGHAYHTGCAIRWWVADSDCCLELKPRDEWPKPPHGKKPRTLNDDWKKVKDRWRDHAGGLGGPPRHRISCFVGGTTVLGEGGLVAVEDLATGNAVRCWDEQARSETVCEILHVHVGQSLVLVHVSLNGETITCTPEHPFWVDGRGWVKAGELGTADHLMSASGERVPIISLERELLSTPIRVYNLSVGGERTFYVGENLVLVHNKSV